jgi:hypothetical protein
LFLSKCAPLGLGEPRPGSSCSRRNGDRRRDVFTSTNGPLRKPDSESDFLRELSRLHRVDKAGALALAEQGDAWYPSTGPFAEARHAMTVTLLVDLGDMDAARRITRALIADNPRSAYLPLVEGVTGIHPRPHGPASTL